MIWLLILVVLAYYSYRVLYAQNHVHEATRHPHRAALPKIKPVQVPVTTTLSPRDEIARTVESLDWCNEITRICWPHIGKIVESHLAPTIEPLINLYLPKPFSKFKFMSASLGKDPLRVDRVTVHRRYKNSIALDLDVSFIGSPNMSMKCAPFHAPFGVKELKWRGRLSVLLRPLIPTLPLVGAVQAAMITHPEVDMDFTGVADFADFGPVEKIVRKVLRNVIASMLVLPNRFIYKLSDTIDYFDVYYPPAGVIAIVIEKGRGFTIEKKLGMIKQVPDLYCKATFGLEDMKTDVRMNNLSPEWNSLKLFILSDYEQPFELKCYDKDTVTRDDLVGSLSLTAKELLTTGPKWVPLGDTDDRIAKHGEIFVGAQLYKLQDPKLPVRGYCLLSILINRATNLPPETKEVACKVWVGTKLLFETPEITKPSEPLHGIDPTNPEWNFHYDVLCDDTSETSIAIHVVERKKTLGRLTFRPDDLISVQDKTIEGKFSIGNGAELRVKVMLRGLAEDSIA
ncbi:unnamed protein product [Chondrus crispus]|uniref:C2 domain-containing protein n=1 Tax=Chondrus crispus TaxID=2769 RepID=R7QJB8_CHOCR|nr:unnamed protein product [Chondrus crispus]CDF38612.1 unnamed protein product [Chondrus crispus]|eukprot:XP_005718517.1 unnamed protein product [Chondrus crispus]